MAEESISTTELEKQVDVLDKRIDRVRSLYEQYFQGIERIEPRIERDAIKRMLQMHRGVHIRNTGLRFRIQQLTAKFNTYENYWNRVTRQIEEGTYKKDLFLAHYRHGSKEERKEPEVTQKVPMPRDPARAPAAASFQSSLSQEAVESLYDAYTTAKQRCKESTLGLTREALAENLKKQIPLILKQYKCKRVEFKVVIKEGKAVIKAMPKND
jgi:hypothetical protein